MRHATQMALGAAEGRRWWREDTPSTQAQELPQTPGRSGNSEPGTGTEPE